MAIRVNGPLIGGVTVHYVRGSADISSPYDADNDGWSVTPQAQLLYSSVDFDDFNDVFNTGVSLGQGDSHQGRLGVTLDHKSSWYKPACPLALQYALVPVWRFHPVNRRTTKSFPDCPCFCFLSNQCCVENLVTDCIDCQIAGPCITRTPVTTSNAPKRRGPEIGRGTKPTKPK